MDLQLVIVIALVVLSAAYLGYRMFGSLGASSKTPAGCSGCSAISSCGIRDDTRSGEDGACNPEGLRRKPFVT
jgi:hypothetical protein